MGKKLKWLKKRQKASGVCNRERKRKKHSLFFSLFLFVENKSFSLLGFSVVQTNPFKSVLLFVAIWSDVIVDLSPALLELQWLRKNTNRCEERIKKKWVDWIKKILHCMTIILNVSTMFCVGGSSRVSYLWMNVRL